MLPRQSVPPPPTLCSPADPRLGEDSPRGTWLQEVGRRQIVSGDEGQKGSCVWGTVSSVMSKSSHGPSVAPTCPGQAWVTCPWGSVPPASDHIILGLNPFSKLSQGLAKNSLLQA